MKCPYCAAQIEDEAALCRACGARRELGPWQAPAPGSVRAKPNFTIVSTGWLLLLSGVWSLFNVSSPVGLFGALRTGFVALLYNGAFGALFLAMGYALVQRKPWALQITWVTSAAYTLDKLALLLDPAARAAALGDSASLLGELAPMVEQALLLSSLLFLAGWWGFALYLYVKRSYFQPS